MRTRGYGSLHERKRVRKIRVLRGFPLICFYSNSRYFTVVCGQKCGQAHQVKGGLFSVSSLPQNFQLLFAAYPEERDYRYLK